MAELLIFHHAQGLTAGCGAFGERMTAAGHTVHLPDLYDGRTFETLEEGIAYAEPVGFDTVIPLPLYPARAAQLAKQPPLLSHPHPSRLPGP